MARDIKIYRDVPVINGYVQTEPSKESQKTSVNAIDAITNLEDAGLDVEDKDLLLGSSMVAVHGSTKGRDRWIRLPGLEPGEGYRDNSGNVIDPSSIIKQ